MLCFRTWFSGGLGSIRLTFGLDDIQGLFQPKQLYDSMIPRFGLYYCIISMFFIASYLNHSGSERRIISLNHHKWYYIISLLWFIFQKCVNSLILSLHHTFLNLKDPKIRTHKQENWHMKHYRNFACVPFSEENLFFVTYLPLSICWSIQKIKSY